MYSRTQPQPRRCALASAFPEHALLVASYNQFFKIDVGTARAWVELLRRCRSCVLFLAELDHAKASLSL
jgi:hypothetical protein